MIRDTEAWRAELIRTGKIVQDDDANADREQAQRDCLRYVELADQVVGTEGRQVFDALLDSMQVADDYEVYEATISALQRFHDGQVGGWLYDGWFALLKRSPARAWDILNQLAREGFGAEARETFNRAWGGADDSQRRQLLALVQDEERGGWLDRPAAASKLRPING